MTVLKELKKNINRLGHMLLNDFMFNLNLSKDEEHNKSFKYLEWINSELVTMVEEFVLENKLLDSCFMKSLKNIFNTDRFELLLKRWIIEYYENLFSILDDRIFYHKSKRTLTLEDNSLNRYGVKQYQNYSKFASDINWCKPPKILKRALSIIVHLTYIIYFGLKNGLKFSSKRVKYVLMREALWGLYDCNGYYFHDDFLVDEDKIKKEDLLLFSRDIQWEEGRVKARQDAKHSCYAHFDLKRIPISANILLSRIFPKYICGGAYILAAILRSSNFSLFSNIFGYFVLYALPYEKIFSNYEIVSELGHNYFSASHIVESIICQNYGTKYYLMHWSDNSIFIDTHLTAFLSCDKFLIWGKAHIQNSDSQRGIYEPTGYIFKKFINKIRADRDLVLDKMGIGSSRKGKIITFFDECFGGNCKLTGEHYVNFWETILKFADEQKEQTVLIKPKELTVYRRLSDNLQNKFIEIKKRLEKMDNVYIITTPKWSFIEAVGVSDIVITQGMSSSATIAIICGIEGLYFDQAQYNHPFREHFKNRLVFDDSGGLLNMIEAIVREKESPIKDIPQDIIRQFDEFPDDRGIELFREILRGKRRKDAFRLYIR